MIVRRDALALGLAALLAPALASRRALAQTRYPARPVKLVIPFPPGGVNDPIGRAWAGRMKAPFGTIVVENIGGAGGSVGVANVARAQPDGYSILLGNTGTQVVNSLASSRPQYDPITSFEPIAILGAAAIAVMVNPAVPVQDLKGLIAYAKANPGKLSYGTPGIGTISQLAAELIKSLAGTPDIVHVPYRGAGPATTDLVAGQIPLLSSNLNGQLLELHRAAKLRILAVTSPARLTAAPDIPTVSESGLPGMVAQNFIGLFAPARTPRDMVEQIAQATRAVMVEQELQQLYVKSGFEPVLDSSPEQTGRIMAADVARWAPVIKAIGLNLD
jgi:tripartite-type tricarboxylate transporter receptor subunit TctC